MEKSGKRRRLSGRSRRDKNKSDKTAAPLPARAGTNGGRYKPIPAADLPKLDAAVRRVLTQIGLSEVPQIVRDVLVPRGGKVTDSGRLIFTNDLIDQFLRDCARGFKLHGQAPHYDMTLFGSRVYLGTGGAAPQVVDLDTGQYRDSTLQDLYDAARIVDTLDNIHFFSRSLVARDMPTDWLLDLNTAYASLAGTAKHVFTSIALPDNVEPLAELFYLIAGSRESFEAKPFVSLNINIVVPPLRFHKESMEVMAEAVKRNIPVHCNIFSQVGASTPVTLAGALVQNTAEALAGMIFGWLINPEAKMIMGVRPMITDLRTGGMSGGSGEQALVMAASAQLAQYYDLPNSCIAGATDSKLADAQSGYEKGMTVVAAAQAGSNLVTQAAGMHAGLMGVAFESYLIDNDMLGGVLRSISPLEINDTTLATDMIDEIVNGEGHFLGHAETYKRMATDFWYPKIADRRSPQEWEDSGSRDMREVAKEKAREILDRYFPNHILPEIDKEIRGKFDIRLEKKVNSER